MSCIKFIGMRCDGCQQPFRNGEGETIFREESRQLRSLAEPTGWACRKWVGSRVVDVCPDCVKAQKFTFKAPTKGRVYAA